MPANLLFLLLCTCAAVEGLLRRVRVVVPAVVQAEPRPVVQPALLGVVVVVLLQAVPSTVAQAVLQPVVQEDALQAVGLVLTARKPVAQAAL